MYVLVEQTKKHNAIYCNDFEGMIVRVTNTAMMLVASTMSISSHELNACWKQLNAAFAPTGRPKYLELCPAAPIGDHSDTT
jgi:hypothetical protein